MQRYNPSEIEPKWQKSWDNEQVYKADLTSDKPKYYAMSMFNYPSGAGIHIGHAMNYTISDVMARYKRQAGYESYHPVGWDSFGLPAENFAIKTGISPQASIAKIIPSYHAQYKAMGWSNDWTREIATSDPRYYRWTQWIFEQVYKAGLAYQDARQQWWCTKCQTVLSNEQVIDGKCWRHDSSDDLLVEKKEIKQWFFKITDYADDMLAATDELNWTESVKLAQKNWIGKSEGAEVQFGLDIATKDSLKFTPLLADMIMRGEKTSTIRLEAKDVSTGDFVDMLVRDGEHVTPFGKAKITTERQMKLGDIPNDLAGHEPYATEDEKLQDYKGYYGDHATLDTEFTVYDFEFLADVTVFTTRPDTLFGATFLVLAPEHPLARQLSNDDTRETVDAYISKALKKSEIERQSEGKEKTGVFTGSHVINPANGERVPVWIADYVLGGYGTGAVMGVPAHDARDYEFATKFQLPIINVINPNTIRDDAKGLDVDVKKDKIVAVVLDDAGRLLTINWGDKGGRLFVGGTVEGDESPETTALREVTEETGYDDLEVVYVADELYHYKYYAHSKQETHETDVRFVLMKLKSDHQIEQNLDESEKGNFKVEWVSESDAGVEIVEPLHRHGYDRLVKKMCYHGEGTLTNSGTFDGMSTSDAREEVVAWLEQQGRGSAKVTYKIRDWSVSRQRYWGAPIPVIHCDACGPQLVPEDQLPVVLPVLDDFAPSGDGRSALARAKDWLEVKCPNCDGKAERETDTLDTYICSSWYYLRYLDPENTELPFGADVANTWMPVDFYNGADHATAHMIYARFITRFLANQGYLKHPEPFKKFLFNGKVTAQNGEMFSKSKGNGVDPLEIINQGYGADALRTYLMFAAPLDTWAKWDPKGVPATHRFLSRIWNLVQEFDASEKDDKQNEIVKKVIHPLIMKVTHDLEQQKYNTAIAAMMEATNKLYAEKAARGFVGTADWQFTLESLTALVSPFAPHCGDELWHQLGRDTSVQRDSWPAWDDQYLTSDSLTIIVQVNGKLRAKLTVATDTNEDEIKNLALADENVKKFVTGEPKKIIYISGKLVSIVI